MPWQPSNRPGDDVSSVRSFSGRLADVAPLDPSLAAAGLAKEPALLTTDRLHVVRIHVGAPREHHEGPYGLALAPRRSGCPHPSAEWRMLGRPRRPEGAPRPELTTPARAMTARCSRTTLWCKPTTRAISLAVRPSSCAARACAILLRDP